MSTRSIVPFGPQHPVLPEPIHIDLVLEDEKVVEAIPSIGFVHRGLEKLVEKKDFNEYVYVAERICGICSFMHGMQSIFLHQSAGVKAEQACRRFSLLHQSVRSSLAQKRKPVYLAYAGSPAHLKLLPSQNRSHYRRTPAGYSRIDLTRTRAFSELRCLL